MRELATFLGVLMLLPGACSLFVMGVIGPRSVSLMFEPFRFGPSDDYGMLALLIWGGSFIISICGMLILWRLRKANRD